MVDTKRLKELIKEQHVSQTHIAYLFGTTSGTIRNKINGKTQFTVVEANRLAETLHLTDAEKLSIFFAPDVCK